MSLGGTDGEPARFPAGALEEISSAVAELQGDQVEFVKRLVRFPSTLGNEKGAQLAMADKFAALGLDVDTWTLKVADLEGLPGFSPVDWAYDDKVNVVGTYRAEESEGRSLILNGHIDVVPPGAERLWSHPPFDPIEQDGWLYGRGAGDMKAGIAAYVFALEALLRAGFEPAANVHLQSVVEEECTGNGTLACLQRGYRADAAVIPEPFAQTLLVAQVGVMWVRIAVLGRPVHVLEATEGVDAIGLAQALIADLKELEKELNEPRRRPLGYRDHAHPINFNVGRFDGGDWPSSVPAEAVFTIRIGFFPDTSLADMRDLVERRVRSFAESHPVLRHNPPHVSYVGFHAEGCEVDPSAELMSVLGAVHRDVTGEAASLLASTASTDARFFNLHGDTVATCYGPVAKDIHGIDEAVNLESLHRTTQVLARFIASWCGLTRR